MAEYSKRDIADLIDRRHRTITYWTDFGLVIPDIQPSQGRGVARLYSDTNLLQFAMIDIMVRELGVSLDTIQGIMNGLRQGSYVDRQETRNAVHFPDFFISHLYGNTRELLLIESRSFTHPNVPERSFALVDNYGTDFKQSAKSFGGVMTIIPLGQVKVMAMEKLGRDFTAKWRETHPPAF